MDTNGCMTSARIAESDRTLSAVEVEQLVCAALDCSPEAHLSVSENVS